MEVEDLNVVHWFGISLSLHFPLFFHVFSMLLILEDSCALGRQIPLFTIFSRQLSLLHLSSGHSVSWRPFSLLPSLTSFSLDIGFSFHPCLVLIILISLSPDSSFLCHLYLLTSLSPGVSFSCHLFLRICLSLDISLCWRLFVLTSVSLGLSSYWQVLPLSSIVYPFLLAVLSSDVPFSGSSFSWQLSSWQFGISISSNLLLRHISFFLSFFNKLEAVLPRSLDSLDL